MTDIVDDRDVLVATINHSYAGFFAYVNFAINQVIYARKKGLRPVVYFGKTSGDGPNAFYDEPTGENTWDYFFEPVDELSYADVQRKVADPADPLTEKRLITLNTKQLWRIHCNERDSVFVYPHGVHERAYGRDPNWYDEQRARAREVVKSCIRVKPHILAKVDAFAEANLAGQPMLGVHIRGTDKGTAHAAAELMRIVPPEEYYPHIDKFLAENEGGKVFVATDQRQFLDQMREHYGDKIIAYTAIRSDSTQNPFDVNDGKGYRKGEEVLIDCLLLSRCDFLIKCTSAVGEFALYFNPELECVDLNAGGEPPSLGAHVNVLARRYGHSVKERYSQIKRAVAGAFQ